MSTDVSVIIPTHRREQLVVRAVSSALAQRGVSVEVVVFDDTNDGSARAAIESVRDPRVEYVKRASPSMGRPALARNEGIAYARGRTIHFLDDDDTLHDGALAALLAALDGRSDVGMSFGLVDAFGDDPEAVAEDRRYYHRAASAARRCAGSKRKLARQILFGTVPFITSSCLVRTEHARELGGFDTSMPVAEDFEFYLRVVRTYGAAFVDRAVLHHRTGLPSLSRNVDHGVWVSAYAYMYRMYKSHFGPVEFYALREWARAARARHLVTQRMGYGVA